MFFKLLLIILFLSVLRCNSDLVNNDTLSLISTEGDGPGKPEPLPNKEALSFLRPTIVRGPPSMLSRYDQMGSYSDIDRVDTEHAPRYINPIPINREFGAVPFGYRTTPLRKSSAGPPNVDTQRSRTRKVNAAPPPFDPHDRAFHGGAEYPYKTSYHSPMGTEYSNGNEEATLEGSGLFKYISPDEFGGQFDLYDSDFDSDSDSGRRTNGESLFDSSEKKQGSLQSALTSLWRYKKLAYQTLLARSGSIGKEMMRNSEDNNSWSKVWKDPGDQNTRANSRFRAKYPNNMPFGDNLGKRTNTESQKSSTTRFRNPTFTPRKRMPGFAVNPNKRNTDTLYSRYPSDTITKRHEIPDGYHLVPRYKDAGHSVRSPYSQTASGDQRRAASNFEGNSPTRRGRTPRMQLVKQIKRVSIVDSNDDFSNRNDDEKSNENDDKNDSNNDVGNDETFNKDDIVVLNVTLIDRIAAEEEEKGNEYYAYYVEDDTATSASNRMDVGTDFYYYDEDYETVDVKADDGGGIVTFEYVDEDEYDDDDDDSVDEFAVGDGDHSVDGTEYVYSSTGNVDVEDTEDDSALSKRQGFFDFPLFGGKKKNEKKKAKPTRRPYPRVHPSDVSSHEGNRRPYSRPLSDSFFSSSDGESSSPQEDFSRGNKTKNIRVRIKSSPNIKKKKKIRMKIMEIKDQSGSNPVVMFPSKGVKHSIREGPIIFHSSPVQNDGSFGPPKDVIPGGFVNQGQRFPSNHNRKNQKGTKTKNYSTTFKKIHLNSGLGGATSTKMVGHDNKKVMSFGGTKNAVFGGLKPGFGGMKDLGFGGKKNKGYGRPTPAGYGGMQQSGYGRPANMGYGGIKNPTVKDSVGWSALTQMSDNLPDLNKAITIMSFVAFSVFVANLGVNALANSSLGIQFGRGDPNFFGMNPDFNLETMIKNLDSLLEEEQKLNGTRGTTFQKVAEFVTAVYNDLHETTRLEMENARDKINNFLERNFSDDDLPVGDISKGYLTKRLEVGQPFGELEDTCYRRLLCLAHNLTMEYKKEDKRNQLLPFWTFGIGWLKGGESNVVNLLENLRAELAGQNGRDCRKLFSDCENITRVEELAKDVKTELEEELDRSEENTQNLEAIIITTTTSRSTI